MMQKSRLLGPRKLNETMWRFHIWQQLFTLLLQPLIKEQTSSRIQTWCVKKRGGGGGGEFGLFCPVLHYQELTRDFNDIKEEMDEGEMS